MSNTVRDRPSTAISIRGLAKTYGKGARLIEAVRGIDLDVTAGETFGFLGPNGAGKSTTIKMLCTLADPTGGAATVAGHDVVDERAEVRRHIGLVFQDPTLDTYLTADQNLRFHAELYGVPRAELGRRLDEVLGMVGLLERRGDLVQTYSGGMKRRLEIARGLLHSPRVLFLFVTTHYMDEAEHCDRIAIMDEGRIVALDTPEALKAAIGEDRIRIQTDDDAAAIRRLAESFGLEATTVGVDGGGSAVSFGVAGGEQFVPRLFGELGVPIRSVTVTRPSLDDVFLAYTGRTIRDAEAAARPAPPWARR